MKGKRVHEVTPFRLDDPVGKKRALDLAWEKSKVAQAVLVPGHGDRWERWVEEFLRARYAGREKTLARVLGAWKQWRAFLGERGFPVPRGLHYQAVLDFVAWRSAQVKAQSKKRVSLNTALCDVRIMSVVMREAMRRGFAETNHCEKLGIQKTPAKQKREMLGDEIAKVRAALVSRPEWMRVSFEIALHQGCRLSETALPLAAVDLEKNTIQFTAKGRKGEKHVFTTQLHSGLRPMLEAMVREGREVTCVLPKMAAKEWHSFFKEIGLPHLCFHCTRVTVITRLARAGVPIQQAMAFVGHASETIHRVYQKLQAPDLDRAVQALQF